MMTAIQQYKARHKEIHNKLRSVSITKSKGIGRLAACKTIGGKLGVSAQTVYNYSFGRIKDGYLAEAILFEFETL